MAIKKTVMKSRPGRGKNDNLRPSGLSPKYGVDANGLTISRFRCECHGHEFETRKILSVHIKAYRTMVVKDFAEMVRTGNLGQPAWERLPGESPMQYARFRTYLTSQHPQTGKRSIERVAAIIAREVKLIYKFAAKWHWTMRADLWDRNIERQEMEEFEREKRASAQRQARLGQKLQEVARAGAVSLLGDDMRVAEMTGNEIAKLADVGTKIERLANQDPTAISEDRGQVRLVWEGPKPSWAPEDRKPDAPEREIGTRTRNVTLPPITLIGRVSQESGARGVVGEAQDGGTGGPD